VGALGVLVIGFVIAKAPSGLLGTSAFWAIILVTISLAASALGIAARTAFVGAICDRSQPAPTASTGQAACRRSQVR
jgi:hypothetical protein